MSLAIFFFLKILFTYSEGREGGREGGRQREGKEGSMQGARYGMGPDPGSQKSQMLKGRTTTSHQASQSLLL